MKKRNLVASALAVISLLAARGEASTDLPYLKTFDLGFVASDPWSVLGSGVAGSATSIRGDAVAVTGDALTLSVGPVKYKNVWVQVYAKPVTGTSDPPAPSCSGAFYLKNTGELMAYGDFSGENTGVGSWRSVGTYTTSAGGWIGFILHIDYDAAPGRWDIYANTGVYGAPMTRLNASPIVFPNSAAKQMTSLTVQSGSLAYVDEVAVSKGFAAIPGTLGNVDTYEFQASQTGELLLPAYSEAYIDPNNQLDGAVGNDLLSGLQEDDALEVYDAGGWSDFIVKSGAWAPDSGPFGNLLPNELKIKPSTSLKIKRKTSGSSSTLGFFPYGSLVIAKDGAAGSDSHTFELTLKGDLNDVDAAGFTAVRWGKATTVSALPWNGNLLDGDRLYKANPAAPLAYKLFVWKSGSWLRWGAAPTFADAQVPVGSKMWLHRAGAEVPSLTVTW